MKTFKVTIFSFILSIAISGVIHAQTVNLVANTDQVPPFTNGQTFNYTLQAVAGTTEYLGVRVKLNYDPAIIQLNSLTPIYDFDFEPTNDTTTAGLIKYEGGDLGTPISGTISIFSIEFQVLDNTQSITISHEYTVANEDGTVVLAIVAGNPVDVLGIANDIVLETLALDAFNIYDVISIYPNPAQDVVTIKIANNQVTIQSISIKTIDGKMILNTTFNGNEANKDSMALDISHLPNALYFLTVETDQGDKKVSKLLVTN